MLPKGNPWVDIGIPAALTLFSMFSGDSGQDEAAAQQAALNKELLDMFRQRENLELPFRKDLLQGLSSRSKQQFPGFKLPAMPPTFNPFSRMQSSMGPALHPHLQARGVPPVRDMMSFLAKKAQRPSAAGGA